MIKPSIGYYLTEETAVLPGWPGHRTRPGRSGLDYIENEYEWAHIQGVLYRSLFTGKFRTENPLHLLLMAYFGIITCLPLVLVAGELFAGNWRNGLGGLMAILTSPYPIIGIAVIINLVINLSNSADDPVDHTVDEEQEPEQE